MWELVPSIFFFFRQTAFCLYIVFLPRKKLIFVHPYRGICTFVFASELKKTQDNNFYFTTILMLKYCVQNVRQKFTSYFLPYTIYAVVKHTLVCFKYIILRNASFPLWRVIFYLQYACNKVKLQYSCCQITKWKNSFRVSGVIIVETVGVWRFWRNLLSLPGKACYI